MSLELVYVHVPNVSRKKVRRENDEGEEESEALEVVEVNVATLCRDFITTSKSIVDFIGEFPYLVGPTKWTMFMFSCKATFAEECLKRLGNLGIGVKDGIGIVNIVPMHMQRIASVVVPKAPAVPATTSNNSQVSSSTSMSTRRGSITGSMLDNSGNPKPSDDRIQAQKQLSTLSVSSTQSLTTEQAAVVAAAIAQGQVPTQVGSPVTSQAPALPATLDTEALSRPSSATPVAPMSPAGMDIVSTSSLQTSAEGVVPEEVSQASHRVAFNLGDAGSVMGSEEEGDGEADSAHEVDTLDTDQLKVEIEKEKSRSEGIAANFMQTIKSRIAVDSVVDLVNSAAEFSFDYVMLVIVASILACIGLVTNNVVVIVASMLVSPLMGPILAVTFGWTIFDTTMMKMGLFSELLGLFFCILVGFIGGLCAAPVVGTDWPTSEMWSRAQASGVIVGICIAIPSGVGVALSVLGNNTSSLVGVAISASLLPPAVNTGILLAMAALYETEWIDSNTKETISVKNILEGSGWSFLLTVANIICIWISGYLMFKLKEVAPLEGKSDFWAKHVPNARAYNTKVLRRDDPEALEIREAIQKELNKGNPSFDTQRIQNINQNTLQAMNAHQHSKRHIFDESFFMPPDESLDPNQDTQKSNSSMNRTLRKALTKPIHRRKGKHKNPQAHVAETSP